MSQNKFVKGFRDCYQYDGKIFYLELIIDGDDVYKPGTLLFHINHTQNILSGTLIKNEFEMTQWDNDKFNQWLTFIESGLSCSFDTWVHDDNNEKFGPVTLSYDHVQNIMTIPLHEGKYWFDSAKIVVDQCVINELHDLYQGINDYCSSIIMK